MNRMRPKTHFGWSGLVVIQVILLVIAVRVSFGEAQQTDAAQGKELRDVFLGTETNSHSSDRAVGRLAILLKDGDSYKQVRPDYPFRSGDRFRFAVATSRDGWLYLLHAGPDGVLKQLWPRAQDDNAIKSSMTYEIPPQPGIFIFDKSVGEEYFYIAIRSTPTPPNLSAAAPKKEKSEVKNRTPPTSAPKKESTEIVNFVIRDPFGETDRGIVFDPGEEGSNPYLYFSTVAADKLKSAVIEFRLRHVE